MLWCYGSGCEGLLGIDKFAARAPDASTASTSNEPSDVCTTQQDCAAMQPSMDDGDGAAASYCVRDSGKCVPLGSDDCTTIAGTPLNDRAILIGSLLDTSGPQGALNRSRQQSVMLAVDEINAAGGIPGPTRERPRPLAFIACDTSIDVVRAADHLTQLGVAAIIGPDDSQAMLELSQQLSIASGTLLLSPTASATTIADLPDQDLLWTMAPTVSQRAALMTTQLDNLTRELASVHPERTLKLAIAYRDDTTGRDTLATLSDVSFGGSRLGNLDQLGPHVRIDAYRSATERSALADAYAYFAPDIVLLIGGTESVTDIMAPLERSLEHDDAALRPRYLLTETSKVPELLMLASQRHDLSARVWGIASTPAAASSTIYDGFQARYDLHFADQPTVRSGMGAAYDATYALAYALASVPAGSVTGARIASGLRLLSGGDSETPVGTVGLANTLQKLSSGAPLSVRGTMAPLQWRDDGAPGAGTIEVWCIGSAQGAVDYASSGLTLDIATQTMQPEFRPCTKASEGMRPDEPGRGPMMQPDPNLPIGGDPDDADAGTPAMPTPGTEMPPETMPPVAAGPVITALPCGLQECAIDRGAFCCVSVLRTDLFQPQRPEDFSCKTVENTVMCAAKLHCSSDRECTNGDVCCSLGTSTGCMAADACTAAKGAHLACETRRDCAADQLCCGHPNMDLSHSTTQCDASCSGLAVVTMCENDKECDGGLQATCQPTLLVPNLRACML